MAMETFGTEHVPADGVITLKPMTYRVTKPVIIPAGVRIQVEPVTPDTGGTLNTDEDIAHGSTASSL